MKTFEADWNNFLSNKAIEEEKIGLKEYRPYEFSLLEEFSRLQKMRYRDYIVEIDRYKGCRPYIENQVNLQNGVPMSASWISLMHSQPFIATQAPFKSNVSIFWEMIAEKEIHQIVMVTELKEENKEKEFAYPYWPQEVNQTIALDRQKVTCIEHTCQFPDSHQFIEIRKFKLEGPLGQRIVTHYWYRNWLDDTAPCQHAILNLLNIVSSETQGHPILVHCSAGIGRTGVFLTLYHLLHAQNSAFKNLFTFIAYLRWQRPYSVAVYPQYEFCYAMHEKLGC